MYLRDFANLSTMEQILLIVNFFFVLVAVGMALAAGVTVPCYLRGGRVCVLSKYRDTDKYVFCDCDTWYQTWNNSKKLDPPQEKNKTKPSNQSYPIVSVLTPMWKDSMDLRLACTGIIVSNDTLLTTDTCKNYVKDVELVKIRSGSNYWAQGGEIHNALEISNSQNRLLMIKVDPPFAETPIELPLKNWSRTSKVYFPSDMYKESNATSRVKYEKFKSEDFTIYQCKKLQPTPCSFKLATTIFLDKFFISCNSLVGMSAINNNGGEIFLDFYQPELMKLLLEIKNETKNFPSTEIKNKGNCSVLYLNECQDYIEEDGSC